MIFEMAILNNQKAADTTASKALLVMRTFAESKIITNSIYLNLSDNVSKSTKKNKKAVKTAPLEESKVFTDYSINDSANYINFSTRHSSAGQAPDTQLEGQRSNKSCLHGHPSSILGWGGPALSQTIGGTL